jgi:hypothetical protein
LPDIGGKTAFQGKVKSGHAHSEMGGHAHFEMTGHLPEMGGHDGLKYARKGLFTTAERFNTYSFMSETEIARHYKETIF